MIQSAIDIYTENGRFAIAAKHHQTIAEMLESQTGDLDRAMQHYETAAEYFRYNAGLPASDWTTILILWSTFFILCSD